LDEAEHSLDVEALKTELSELHRSKAMLDSKLKLLEFVFHSTIVFSIHDHKLL